MPFVTFGFCACNLCYKRNISNSMPLPPSVGHVLLDEISKYYKKVVLATYVATTTFYYKKNHCMPTFIILLLMLLSSFAPTIFVLLLWPPPLGILHCRLYLAFSIALSLSPSSSFFLLSTGGRYLVTLLALHSSFGLLHWAFSIALHCWSSIPSSSLRVPSYFFLHWAFSIALYCWSSIASSSLWVPSYFFLH